MKDERIVALKDCAIGQGLAGASDEVLLRGLCERLLDAGVPVQRAVLGLDTLPPVIEGRVVAWARGTGETSREEYTRAESKNDDWLRSPFHALEHSGERVLRRRLGPAVNEASRIEAMCGSLDQRVIVSSAFAGASPDCRSRLVSLGRYALRGVARPQELFTLDPEAPFKNR